MLERAPEQHNVVICSIISDDDSNGRAKAQFVINGGQLRRAVEQPSFKASPSHRKWVFARAIYQLALAPKKTSKVTKNLATHLKYCYGACVKRNRHLPAEELSKNVYNVLEHICDNHDQCDIAWCYNVKPTESGKVYNAPKEHQIDKINDPVTYLQWQKNDQYACIPQMEYFNHPFDTQTNKAWNQAIATVAPKNVCYSSSGSLFSRVTMVIGIHSLGKDSFFQWLLHELSVSPDCLSRYLTLRDNKEEKKRVYKRNFDVKFKRSKQQKDNREEVFQEWMDISYGLGVGLTAGIPPTRKGNDSNGGERNNKKTKACKCGITSHQRTTHRKCPLKQQHNPAMIQPPPIALPPSTPKPVMPWPTTTQTSSTTMAHYSTSNQLTPVTPWPTSTNTQATPQLRTATVLLCTYNKHPHQQSHGQQQSRWAAAQQRTTAGFYSTSNQLTPAMPWPTSTNLDEQHNHWEPPWRSSAPATNPHWQCRGQIHPHQQHHNWEPTLRSSEPTTAVKNKQPEQRLQKKTRQPKQQQEKWRLTISSKHTEYGRHNTDSCQPAHRVWLGMKGIHMHSTSELSTAMLDCMVSPNLLFIHLGDKWYL